MFKKSNIDSYVNSEVSREKLYNIYISQAEFENSNVEIQTPYRTFAPSSMRCARYQWFRLRGTVPDVSYRGDVVYDFFSKVGDMSHELVQKRLYNSCGKFGNYYGNVEFLDVEDYVIDKLNPDWKYTCSKSENGYETRFELKEPYPIRFSCDGICRIDGEDYLIEIKSLDYRQWCDAFEIMSRHRVQAYTYCAFLKLSKIIFIYVDRTYGNIKCFESEVSDEVVLNVYKYMDDILECTKTNIAPDGLSKGDGMCRTCMYHKTCMGYGRYE